MAIYDYDTLAYHAKERPGTMRRSLAHIPLKQIGPATQHSVQKCGGPVKATREAISFYLLNHAMNEVGLRADEHEPLNDMLPVVEQYHHALNTLGYRLFNYLVIITTRESRHITNSQHKNLVGDHGSQCVAFTDMVKAKSQDALFETQSDIPLGKYLDYLLDIYFKCSWSGAYGGPAWGKVTRALRDFVYGETNMETLLDIGYTLAHNGGPIFDKGFHYTGGKGSIFKVLDVQRAGQIPQLVKAKSVSEVEQGHITLLDMIEKAIPGFKVNPWVNWPMVDQLGAIHGPYHHEHQANESNFGHLPDYKAEKQALEQQKQAILQAKAAKQASLEKNYIEIMPGVKLKKGVMKRVKG